MTMLLGVTHEMEFARRMTESPSSCTRDWCAESGPSEAFFSNPQTPEARQFVGAGAIK